MALTNGLQLGYGIQPLNPVPVDSWSGPYSGADEATAKAAANAAIPTSIRFQSMEVRLVYGGSAYKFWYKNGISNTDLVEFKSGSTLNSVGLTMPPAFAVANSPLTIDGTLAVTALGVSSQYIRGDGQLATLPTFSGGGSSVNYYLNGSIPASVSGYEQLSTTPVLGIGTDYTLSTNGLIAQFLTDVGDPDRILIPAGGWIFEMFFSVAAATPTCKFYVELLKYDGVTFTSIANSSAVPEALTGGSTIDLYTTSLAVPEYTLLITDRLVIRVYIVDNIPTSSLVTLHTENSHLCEIVTTFSVGLSSLNGLTDNTQYLAVGTLGSDFYISSVADTHTFNLPTASSIYRGALSSADWIMFNGKQDALGFTPYDAANPAGYISISALAPYQLISGLGSAAYEDVSYFQTALTNPVTGTGTPNTLPKFTGTSEIGDSNISDSGSLVTITGDSLFNGNITISQPAALRFVQENAIVVPPMGQSAIDAVNETLTFISNPGSFYKGFALDVSGLTNNSLWYYSMPNANGTLALTSDIHDAVTIGTANGLSLIGQQLSLGLSSGSSNGALSSTDWNKFNSAVPAGIPTLGDFVFYNGSNLAYLTFLASPPLSYNAGSGTISISQSTTSTNGYLSSSDWNTFNSKQNSITLTTTGNSGAATFIGGTLNIPQYITATTQSFTGVKNFNDGIGIPVNINASFGGSSSIYEDDVDGYFNIFSTAPMGINISVGVSILEIGESIALSAFNTLNLYADNQGLGVGSINFNVAGSPKATIINDGKFGIGTTIPTQKLHVIGNGLFSGNVTATTFVGNLNGTANNTINWVGYGIYNDDPSYVDPIITEPYLLFGYYPDGYFRSFDQAQVQSFVGIGNGSTLANNISGNAATATNASQLNGQLAAYYTDIPARLGYTPVNQTRLINTTSPLLGGGDLSADRTLSIQQATSLQAGYLSATDWNTFNNKSTIPALTSGSVLFSNGTTISQDNANFFWDNTNKRLGIGTVTPATFLNIYNANSNAAKTEVFRMEVKNSANAVLDYFKFTLGATTARGGGIIFGESGGGFSESGLDFNLNHTIFYQGGAYPIYLKTNNVNRVTVTGTGTVLMNQTTDDLVNKLQLTGNAKITATSAITSSTLLTLFSGSTFAATQDANTGYSLNFDAIGYNPGNYFTRTGAQIQMLKIGSWNREATGTNYASLVFSLNNSATNTLIERMRLSYTGNLLLGSAVDDLTNKLQVTGGSIVVKNSGIPALNLYRDLDVTVVGAAGQGIQFGARSGSTFIAGAAIYGNLSNPATTGSLNFQTLSGGSLVTRLIINSDGNVGIANTSPSQLLTVGLTGGAVKRIYIPGTYNFDGAYLSNYDANGGGKLELVAHTGVSTSASWQIANNNDTYAQSLTFSRAAGVSSYGTLVYGAPSMLITQAGNLAIGLSSPVAKLHVAAVSTYNSDTVKAFRVSDSTTISKAVDIGFDAVLDKGFIQAANFGVNWSDLVIQPNGGNVGIGTSSPTTKLDVNGSVSGSYFNVQGGTAPGYQLTPSLGNSYVVGTNSTINGFGVYNINSLTWRLVVKDTTGNVGIGTTNPSYPLHVATQVSNISIYADYDIVAYSDQSVKENIRPIDNALNRVVKSRGVLYDRIDSGSKNNIGFIAQELEIEFPELVVENPDGTKAVKYQNAIAVLFEAIKEQQKQIEELKLLIG